MIRFRALRVCQSKNFSIIPQVVVRYDLDRAAALLGEAGYDVTHQDVMIVARKEGVEVTLYVNGRLMVEPAESKAEAGKQAESFYESIDGAREEGSD